MENEFARRVDGVVAERAGRAPARSSTRTRSSWSDRADDARRICERWHDDWCRCAGAREPRPNVRGSRDRAGAGRATPHPARSAAVRPDRLPGEFPYTRGVQPTMYRGRALDDAPVRRASAPRRSRTSATATCSSQGTTGPLGRVRSADPDGARLGPPARARRGRPGRRRDRLASTTCSVLLDGLPLDEVSTSMTINATASTLLALYVAVARGAGVPRRPAPRHHPERHPQGVHRARDLHLPAARRACGS